MTDRTVPRQAGWWHFTPAGWVPVTGEQARALEDAGQGLDLVYVETVGVEEKLW
jgi:hypothetical protein